MSTPQVILGLEAKLYRNTGSHQNPTWTEIKNVKDLTLTIEKGEADVTTRAAGGWRQTVATLKEATVEFEMVWDPGDAGCQAIKDAFFNGTAIELAIMDGPLPPASGKTSQGLRALFAVTKFGRNEPLEEALTVPISLKPTYGAVPEWYSQTGS
jgi:predicted secreted protein